MEEQTDEIQDGMRSAHAREPEAEPSTTGKRGRRRKAPAGADLLEADALREAPSGAASAAEGEADPAAFTEIDRLRKKGLSVVPVVTGAVVDSAGNFLFYVDGHDDARASVQAQLNYILKSGPSREEHLARARARVAFLARKLTEPR